MVTQAEAFTRAQALFPGWPRENDPDIVVWPLPMSRQNEIDCIRVHSSIGWGAFSSNLLCRHMAADVPRPREQLFLAGETRRIGGFFGEVAGALRGATEALQELIPPETVARIIAIGASVALSPAVGASVGRLIARDQISEQVGLVAQQQGALVLDFVEPPVSALTPAPAPAPGQAGPGRALIPLALAALAAILFLG